MVISVNINNLRGVARQKGEEKAALKRAGEAGKEKKKEDEVLDRGKGGTTVILSAL